MSKETVDSNTSTDNMDLPIAKSSTSLHSNTKTLVLPPNILQNICISDSVSKDESVTSSIEPVKRDSTLATVITQEHKKLRRKQMRPQMKPIDDTNNVVSQNVTEVPRLSRNDKQLISKVSCIEQMESCFSIIEKQGDNEKIYKSATDSTISLKRSQKMECTTTNVRNDQTTSKDTVKPQEAGTEFEQNTRKLNLEKYLENQSQTESKNKIDESILGKSKRTRKQTKFDTYVVACKKDSPKQKVTTVDQNKKCISNKEQKQITVSNTLSNITKINQITNNNKSTKGILQNMQHKKGETANDLHRASTSNIPAITKKSLPLCTSNISENHFNVENNKTNSYVNHLQDSKNTIDSTCVMLKDKDTMELNNESDNRVYKGSKSTSLLEHAIMKQNDLETNLKSKRTKDFNDKDIGKLFPNSEDVKCIDANTIKNKSNLVSIEASDSFKQETLNATPINQVHADYISATTALVRKRGRPKKTLTPQEILGTSNKLEENLETSLKSNNTSIAQTIIHSKRHDEKSYNIPNDDLSDDSSSESNTPNSSIVRKRGRPPGTSTGRGRGRGKGRGRGRGRGKESSNSTLDADYLPKLKGPNIDTTKHENSTEIADVSHSLKVNLVTCAKCETEILQKQWNSHNLMKHNNMSWKKGDEPMDFENDIKLWRRVLMAALKKKKGQLSCEKCKVIKRSANGFISHMQFCGKTDEEKKALMVKCPICGATMMPSSMEIHERVHRQSEQSRIKELQSYTLADEKVKRKAAEKAVSKILEFTELVKDNNLPPKKKTKLESLKNIIKMPEQKKAIPGVWKGIWKKELSVQGTISCRQIGCTFTCSSFEDICKHFSECNFTPQENYVCKICKFSTTSEEDIIKHVKENHTTMEDSDKYSDFEEESYSSDEKTSYTMKFLDKENVYKIQWKEPYFPTIHWTMEFEQKNYELHLFNDYIPNQFTLLKNADAIKYLPELEVSMRIKKEGEDFEKLSNNEISWKQWKRFEGGFDEDTPTFFVGGPVWAVAWLPIPSPMYSKNPFQYVAISTHPTMESEYAVGNSYSGANIIQIWNVGPLNHEADNKKYSPVLSYAIAHNGGTIWCLEWCPSGCYQDEILQNYKVENETQSSFKRMGMLAAASSDGNVYIYSLPFPEELKFNKIKENEWPIYSIDPIMTLVVNISIYNNNNQNWQCTKLSWSKEHGHNTIAAGFSNGYIALWDLTYKSPLSMQKKQNTFFINAFQHFYAHGNAISMIALVPYNEARFLASGSLDRSYKFWDLENISSPQYSIQKGIIVDGAWMTHWPSAVISFDDALGYKHTNSYLIPLREHEFKYYPILATNSPTYALAVSDYANSIAHGTLAGEIVTIFPHQLIYSKDIEKALRKRRKLSSFIKIVDFLENDNKNDKKDKKNSKDYHYMPETYNECKDRFGVIFCDNLKNIERYAQQRTLHAEKLTPVPIEEYPFMSINRMSWNPNAWSYLWLMVGYQNGLVRLLNFKYMSMPRELKMWLSRHAEFMLKKTKMTTQKN